MRMNCNLRICPVCGKEFYPCEGRRCCSMACQDKAVALRAVVHNAPPVRERRATKDDDEQQ